MSNSPVQKLKFHYLNGLVVTHNKYTRVDRYIYALAGIKIWNFENMLYPSIY